jgi:hypothetical protein
VLLVFRCHFKSPPLSALGANAAEEMFAAGKFLVAASVGQQHLCQNMIDSNVQEIP